MRPCVTAPCARLTRSKLLNFSIAGRRAPSGLAGIPCINEHFGYNAKQIFPSRSTTLQDATLRHRAIEMVLHLIQSIPILFYYQIVLPFPATCEVYAFKIFTTMRMKSLRAGPIDASRSLFIERIDVYKFICRFRGSKVDALSIELRQSL